MRTCIVNTSKNKCSTNVSLVPELILLKPLIYCTNWYNSNYEEIICVVIPVSASVPAPQNAYQVQDNFLTVLIRNSDYIIFVNINDGISSFCSLWNRKLFDYKVAFPGQLSKEKSAF